jgi:hypothetical protein
MAGRRSDVVSFWWFSWEKQWKTMENHRKTHEIYIYRKGTDLSDFDVIWWFFYILNSA